MSSHPETCRCSFDAQIATSRHACYRQLARAILGPLPPQDDLALAHALAEHVRFMGSARTVTPIRRRRAA
jgi:hypothetical protein